MLYDFQAPRGTKTPMHESSSPKSRQNKISVAGGSRPMKHQYHEGQQRRLEEQLAWVSGVVQ